MFKHRDKNQKQQIFRYRGSSILVDASTSVCQTFRVPSVTHGFIPGMIRRIRDSL